MPRIFSLRERYATAPTPIYKKERISDAPDKVKKTRGLKV